MRPPAYAECLFSRGSIESPSRPLQLYESRVEKQNHETFQQQELSYCSSSGGNRSFKLHIWDLIRYRTHYLDEFNHFNRELESH